jgi:hypothetical protein
MGFSFAGMASAVDGFYRGRDDETARQNAQEDREYARGQRAYQAGQQARTVQEQQRADQLRGELTNNPTEVSTDLNAGKNLPQVDDDGNPSAASLPAVKTEAVPMDVQFRRDAAAYRKAGDRENWLKSHQAADKFAWDRSAKKFQELAASSTNMTPAQIAQSAADLFNNDALPGEVKNIKDLGAGGVAVDIVSRETGGSVSLTFKTPAEILQALHSRYSPATFAQIQAQRQASANKVQEEAMKPQRVSPGQAVVVNGKVVYQAPQPAGTEYVGDDAQGNPVYRKIATGGAAGSGKGKGAAPGNPADVAFEALQEVAKLKTAEVTEEQYLAAKDHAARIVQQNPEVPPVMAARVAFAVAKDPTKLQPAINPKTGMIDMIYKDGVNGSIAFQRGVADAISTNGIPREQLVQMTASLLKSLPALERETMVKASNNSAARGMLESSISAQAEKVIAEKVAGATPEQATQVRKNVEAALAQRLQAIGKQLDLVHNYGPKPKSDTAPPNRLYSRGGLAAAAEYVPPAGSPAAKVQANRDQARASSESRDAAASAQQTELSTQFQQDAKTLAPLELARKYDRLRGRLPVRDAATLQAIERQIR